MSEVQPILKSFTNKAKLKTDETLIWTIEYLAPQAAEIPEMGDQIQGLRVIDFEKLPPVEFKGMIKQQRIYKLKADLSGTYLLPSVKVNQLSTTEIFVEYVTGNENKTSEITDIRDIKPIIITPFNYTLWGSILGVLIVIVLMGLWLKGKWKKPKLQIIPMLPPYELAMSKIPQVQDLFELSFILREFTENEFKFSATDLTLEQLRKKIYDIHQINDGEKSIFLKLLEEMDFIKFTNKKITPEEFEIFIDRVKAWVEIYKPKPVVPQNSEQESVI